MISAKFSELQNKVITKIDGKVGDEEMVFTTYDGDKYRLIYHQDCCASCNIEDICGELSDLIGTPILVAEEVSSHENPEGFHKEFQEESFTWNFYKLSTIKGSVTIRWYGESNGYYSEQATFERF